MGVDLVAELHPYDKVDLERIITRYGRDDVLAAMGVEVNADDEWRELPTDMPKNHAGKSRALLCVFYVPEDDDGQPDDELAEVFADMIVNDINDERSRVAAVHGLPNYRPWEVCGIPGPQFLTSAQLVEFVKRMREPSQPPTTGGGGCTVQKEL